jgi:hypothetical protein
MLNGIVCLAVLVATVYFITDPIWFVFALASVGTPFIFFGLFLGISAVRWALVGFTFGMIFVSGLGIASFYNEMRTLTTPRWPTTEASLSQITEALPPWATTSWFTAPVQTAYAMPNQTFNRVNSIAKMLKCGQPPRNGQFDLRSRANQSILPFALQDDNGTAGMCNCTNFSAPIFPPGWEERCNFTVNASYMIQTAVNITVNQTNSTANSSKAKPAPASKAKSKQTAKSETVNYKNVTTFVSTTISFDASYCSASADCMPTFPTVTDCCCFTYADFFKSAYGATESINEKFPGSSAWRFLLWAFGHFGLPGTWFLPSLYYTLLLDYICAILQVIGWFLGTLLLIMSVAPFLVKFFYYWYLIQYYEWVNRHEEKRGANSALKKLTVDGIPLGIRTAFIMTDLTFTIINAFFTHLFAFVIPTDFLKGRLAQKFLRLNPDGTAAPFTIADLERKICSWLAATVHNFPPLQDDDMKNKELRDLLGGFLERFHQALTETHRRWKNSSTGSIATLIAPTTFLENIISSASASGWWKWKKEAATKFSYKGKNYIVVKITNDATKGDLGGDSIALNYDDIVAASDDDNVNREIEFRLVQVQKPSKTNKTLRITTTTNSKQMTVGQLALLKSELNVSYDDSLRWHTVQKRDNAPKADAATSRTPTASSASTSASAATATPNTTANPTAPAPSAPKQPAGPPKRDTPPRSGSPVRGGSPRRRRGGNKDNNGKRAQHDNGDYGSNGSNTVKIDDAFAVNAPANGCWITSVLIVLQRFAQLMQKKLEHLPAEHILCRLISPKWAAAHGAEELLRISGFNARAGSKGNAIAFLSALTKKITVPGKTKGTAPRPLSYFMKVNEDYEPHLDLPVGALLFYEGVPHYSAAIAKKNKHDNADTVPMWFQPTEPEYTLDKADYVFYVCMIDMNGGGGNESPEWLKEYGIEPDAKCALCKKTYREHHCKKRSAVICADCEEPFFGNCGCGNTPELYGVLNPYKCRGCMKKAPPPPARVPRPTTASDPAPPTPAAPAATSPPDVTSLPTATSESLTPISVGSAATAPSAPPTPRPAPAVIDPEAASDLERGPGGYPAGTVQTPPMSAATAAAIARDPQGSHHASPMVTAMRGDALVPHLQKLKDQLKTLRNYWKGIPLGLPRSAEPPRECSPDLQHAIAMTSQSYANREQQLRNLDKFAEYSKEHLEEAKKSSLPDFLITHLLQRSREGKNREGGTGWKAATLHRTAASFVGAFNAIHLFLRNETVDRPIKLMDSTTFYNAFATMKRAAMETQPVGQAAATADDILEAMSHAPTKARRMQCLVLWATGARVGCTNKALAANITIDLLTGNLRFHVAKGKGVLVRQGKYEIHTRIMNPELRKELFEYLSAIKDKTSLAFPPSPGCSLASRTKELNTMLKKARSDLTTRAVRRGSLQAMSTGELTGDPVAEEVLMAISGHKSKETLNRYLDWSLHNEAQHVKTRRAAANLALPASPAAAAAGAAPAAGAAAAAATVAAPQRA